MPGQSREREKLTFLGMEFDVVTQDGAYDRLLDLHADQRFTYVVTPNVDHVVSYHRESCSDNQISKAYTHADLTLCDSRILAFLAERSGFKIPVVTGSDLTARLLRCDGPWDRIAVVGGNRRLLDALSNQFPQFQWLLFEPPMGVRNDPIARANIAQFVEECGADLVFFAIGAPQSEICCSEIAERGKANCLALCSGASLEFLTGFKRRAPKLLQRYRLEWLHRLASEPRRLWRRYLVNGPQIFHIWWRSTR